MLAVSALGNTVSSLGNNRDAIQGEMVGNYSMGVDDFPDFGDENLLDSIDFDDLFVGINDGDLLPDLDMDQELLAEFPHSAGEDSDVNASLSAEKYDDSNSNKDDEGKSRSISGYSSPGEEIVSKRQEIVVCNPSAKEVDKSRKSLLQTKNNSQGKRKVKVDWTPELHRRFVQAVEQLGVDKAVPSRILELMGIECLTRHNIASHLQKYRSHRKHLLAREAEAASWSQRRQMYGAGGVSGGSGGGGGGGGGKREMVSPWLAPTMGFPPMTPPLHHHHHFRPLHVWGHPTVDQSVMHMWPKRLPHSLSPIQPLPWPPAGPPPPSDSSSFWHPHHQRVQNGVTSGTPCFPQPITTRFPSSPVPGIPSHALYKVDNHGNNLAVRPHSPPPQPPFDFHPSKESVDAAIGDVLSKPWLPLPLGLKPPSLDGVMVELQRQGIPKIPPSSYTA